MFVTPIEDQTVKEIPGVAKFECEITKSGITAQWKRGNKMLKPSDKYDIIVDGGVHCLVVRNVDGEDEDDYSVGFGDVKSSAKLFVKGITHTTTYVQG